jgi:conjugative relaxase-like TrwC/TraI family protein
MLTISPPIHAAQGDYYLKLAQADDYYLDASEPPGFWLGQGAAALGLRGQLQPEDFRTLLNGRTPDGRQVRNADSAKRRAGWDLTWSAPKSVSVAWSQAEAPDRAEIEAALAAAVAVGVGYLETVGVVSRVGENGVVRDPARLVFAAFLHSTSRAQQPQLHIHTVLPNLALRTDNKIGTLEPRELYRHQLAAGALFRVQLAHELEQRLGLRARREKRCFEIIGVDRKLMETFSKRRQEIEAALKQSGLSGPKAAERAALASRSRKRPRPRSELFAEWRQVGLEHQWSTRELALLLHSPWSPRNREHQRQRVSRYALAELTFRESHFPERRLTQHLAEEAQGRGLSAHEVLELKNAVLVSPELVSLSEVQGEPQYTTREMLRLEASLLQHATVMQGRKDFGVAPGLDAALDRHPTLSSEQQAALVHLCGDGAALRLVSGMAGTGKSHLLGVAHEVWKEEGLRVLGSALSGKAASGLQEGSEIPSQTLHRLFHALEAGRLALDARTVVVVDEAGMVGTRQMHALLQDCVATGARLVLCGDAGQLQAVEAGGPFGALVARLGAAELKDIRRQQEPWARRAVLDMASGEARAALAAYGERGLLHQVDEPEPALVESWKRGGGLILAGSNDEVARLNLAAQAVRGLAGQGLVHPGGSFFASDRVLFTRNDPKLGVFNGDLGTISAADADTVEVLLDQGRTVVVDLKKYEALRLGYAVTTHKAQGLTTDATLILTGPMQDRELSYVQVSRARHRTEIFGPAESEERLATRMSRSRRKTLACDLAPDLNHEYRR